MVASPPPPPDPKFPPPPAIGVEVNGGDRVLAGGVVILSESACCTALEPGGICAIAARTGLSPLLEDDAGGGQGSDGVREAGKSSVSADPGTRIKAAVIFAAAVAGEGIRFGGGIGSPGGRIQS